MQSKEVRRKFLEFFESKNHLIVSSAPLVVKDDPTLLFTNAGMNPFKEYFLGNGKPKATRVADTQKCLRVSGKHNDLEEVGHDTYHHTMFEMLGNWSFGDYFKKEAISWAWELLTQVYKIDKNNLYVTIFEGDEKEHLERDEEAYEYWRAFLPQERILNGNKKDNFWEMGDQGPCGPCSEIHIDLRSEEEKRKTPGCDLVNKDHPQVVEIWNLVFMQFNRKADGSLEKLASQHIDTGMGFERLCMALQGKQSNYDTDVFTPLLARIEEITGEKYGVDKDKDIAFRVIADHIRAVSFAIVDGQLPSNNGAGYVIRRILRRAIRYGFTYLGKKEPFIYEIVATLAEQMGEFFPEIQQRRILAENVIKEEEISFLRTLEQGLLLLEAMMSNEKSKHISGKKAFELYDTYGFPIDLTALILSERGFTLDEKGFEQELQKQKERSRSAAQVKAGDWVVLRDDEEEEFVGYDTLSSTVKITRYRQVENQKEGQLYQIVFNMTPFYPEGGGQVGDKGTLTTASGDLVYIIDTKKENNLIIHLTQTLPSNIEEPMLAQVNSLMRTQTECNHTATHLLHQALRNVLGTTVEQRGSRVDAHSLRFDFSHFYKLTSQEIVQVENFVNEHIKRGIALEEQRSIPIGEAISQGAMALFGEKYGENVRMIRFGESRELCGGTHTKNTSNLWHFKIVSEGAVASGIRRIEAITGLALQQYYSEQEQELLQIKSILKNTQNPIKAIGHLQEENNRLVKEIEVLKKEQAQAQVENLNKEFQTKAEVAFLAKELNVDSSALKDIAFALAQNKSNAFVVLACSQGEKATIACYISKELVAKKGFDAGKIVRELGKYIQGGGGGQPFFATAGGKNSAGIAQALAQVEKIITEI